MKMKTFFNGPIFDWTKIHMWHGYRNVHQCGRNGCGKDIDWECGPCGDKCLLTKHSNSIKSLNQEIMSMSSQLTTPHCGSASFLATPYFWMIGKPCIVHKYWSMFYHFDFSLVFFLTSTVFFSLLVLVHYNLFLMVGCHFCLFWILLLHT